MNPAGVTEISVSDLADRLKGDERPLVLDVREPWEHRIASLEGTENVPMDEVPDHLERLRALARDGLDEVFVLCHRGNRSRLIARFLQQNGFRRVVNVAGGIDAWTAEVDRNLTVY